MNNPSLDPGRALTFMFEEEEWLAKFLIAAAMVLFGWLILPALILQGYGIELIRRVGRSATPALPEWDEWGRYLSDGLIATVALLVYSLPLVFVSCCMGLMLAAASDNTSGEVAGGVALLACCLGLFVFLLQVPLWGLYYAGMINYAARGGIGAYFSGGLLRYVRRQPGQYVTALLLLFLAGLVGGLVPILGPAWSQMVSGHVLGQLLRLQDGPVEGEVGVEDAL